MMTKAMRNPVVIVHDPSGDFSPGKAFFGLQEFFCEDAPSPWAEGTEIERNGERFCLCDGDLVWLPQDPIKSNPTPEQEQRAILYADKTTGKTGILAVRKAASIEARWFLNHSPGDRCPFSIRGTGKYIPPWYRQIIREMHRKWMGELLKEKEGKE